jgi:hypothetical protein
MGAIAKKSLDQPDERRTPDKTTMDLVTIGETTFARVRFEPGWRWSECIKPVVGGDSCQAHHIGYVISGQIHVVHSDGSELDLGAGDAMDIGPGHDAWVVGDEPYVGIEVQQGTIDYAKPSS